MKKLLSILMAAVLAAFLATGCKKEKKQAAPSKPGTPVTNVQPNKVATPEAQVASPVATPEAGVTKGEEKTGEKKPGTKVGYFYNPIREDGKQKRSPMQPIAIPLNPTRTYETTQLGVNGVILHGVKQASVMTPNCQSTFVKVGDMVGNHDGVVVDITLAGVLVREPFVDITGKIKEFERLIPNQPYPCK